MAHYAKIENGIVTQIIVAEQEIIDSGIFGDTSFWVKTSYNTFGNVHYGENGLPDDGVPLRGNYAGIGHIYDKKNDVFYSQQNYPSWVLNEKTWLWEPPIECPKDNNTYEWDESTKSWVIREVIETNEQQKLAESILNGTII
jgi:hypothetical protein